MAEKQEKIEAEPTGEATAGRRRAWLQPLLEAVSDRPPLKRLLEAGIAFPLLTAGTDSLLTDFNYLSILLGLGIGIPFAGAVFEPLIANWQLEITAVAFISAATESLVRLEFRNALVAFLIALPPGVPVFMAPSLNAYRQQVSYCYGAFLGPLVCYHFVVKWCLTKMGLGIDLGTAGYVIALLVGFVLALEMPLIYYLANIKKDANLRAVGDSPSLLPLTFAVGMIMGVGSMLILYVLGLMLLWPAGYVVAPVLAVIIFYALRPL